MAFKKQDEQTQQRYRKPYINRLSKAQLEKLDEELNTFREYVPENQWFPKPAVMVNQTKWMISRGAKDKNGAVIISGYSPTEYDSNGKSTQPLDCDPILYEQLLADWDQWLNWIEETKPKRESPEEFLAKHNTRVQDTEPPQKPKNEVQDTFEGLKVQSTYYTSKNQPDAILSQE